jgi:tight adherence protein B
MKNRLKKGQLRKHGFRTVAGSFLVSAVVTVMTAYLFFDSMLGMIPAGFIGYLLYRKCIKAAEEKEKLELLSEFGTLINTVAASLSSGMSVENAFKGAGRDLDRVYDRNHIIMKELRIIEKKLETGEHLHDALYDMAERHEQEEIRDFAGVLATIERTGGNTIKIIKKTVETITGRIELREEIGVMVAGKKLEQRIMTCMPFVIVLYLRFSNAEYLEPLYGSVGGRLVMCIALAGIALADHLGSRITDWNTL